MIRERTLTFSSQITTDELRANAWVIEVPEREGSRSKGVEFSMPDRADCVQLSKTLRKM